MEEIVIPTLRETLTANLEAAESGTLPTTEERARDEGGRYAKQEKVEKTAPIDPAVTPDVKPALTTWKKEYLPIHEKLGKREALTPEEMEKLHAYNFQR